MLHFLKRKHIDTRHNNSKRINLCCYLASTVRKLCTKIEINNCENYGICSFGGQEKKKCPVRIFF